MVEKHKSTDQAPQKDCPELGQTDAKLEKISEDQLEHMEGGEEARKNIEKKKKATDPCD